MRPAQLGSPPPSPRRCIAARAQVSVVQQGQQPPPSGKIKPNTTTTKQPHLRIFFATPWESSVLHGSISGAPWRDIPLQRVASAPSKWSSCFFPVPPSPPAPGVPLLEFVLRNNNNEWNKPLDGGNYTIEKPGNYVVQNNAVSQSKGKPLLLITDLDGTLVGSDDSATAAFRDWWEEEAVARGSGSVLAFNTGRSLDSIQELMRKKSHCLPQPDVLISAVGTKVYTREGSGKWVEDAGWTKQLDRGWKLDVVRDAAYEALDQVGKENMHFRPKEELNPHKVTCGVKRSVLSSVLASMGSSIAAAGVFVNFITSGGAEWVFLDVVPVRAGKLEAAQYVQGLYGFSTQQTVAAGDSGNDILMLQGEVPAIVVGNSQQDLLAWYDEQMKIESNMKSGPGGRARLHLAPKHEALSILEGLRYYGHR